MDHEEVKKAYETIPESLKAGYQNLSTKNGKRTQSLMFNTFGYYPTIIPAIKSMFVTSFTFEKEEEKLVCIQKLVSPEEGNENFPYSKKTKNYQYTNKHGKKAKMTFVHGQGIFHNTFKKMGDHVLFEHFFCKNLKIKQLKAEKV
jgi:hypothetical protein